jgi:hypothetical protein
MKTDFAEDRSADGRDPMDAASQDFDWQHLYRRLCEDASDADQDQRLAEAVTRLLQMLVPCSERQIRPDSVGLRVIALAWVLNPAYFGGSPSLRQVARRCGVTQGTLAHHTGRHSRLIGWRNRAQQHAWNWREQSRSGEDHLIRPRRPDEAATEAPDHETDSV